ncbi:acylneuraminate cytidylyltransferase, spore coat polysaccharide biosynthesis protein spsF [Candidatus Magnetobacterium bavaricum]|uniref:Acylneuraminate cytidylyltransferase, spore coat polysaccharide biosynthesis protein spsF n=1 Tax=Candidatus Magnetobacterium bavaricum TaxID=29290 RepID=A0A0F3GJF8_9BACT|nr:acylneuraminate cytidylyltransferase, spore coat polysaccharide biosynthesis protein spsF [Candidatus Magnetobacterium bavaricum]
MSKRVIATIEARMGSSRFPGKTLKTLHGKTLLEWTVHRLMAAKRVDDIVVATTDNLADDAIAELCIEKNINYFRGSEEDVLKRVTDAAKMMAADVIVQSGADCPLYDPDIVDELLNIYLANNYHYVCNDFTEGYPKGVNVHVFSFDTLTKIEKLATSAGDRENVVTYIWDHQDKFTIFNLSPPAELNRPDIRITVDYPEDIVFVNELLNRLDRGNFRTIDIVRLLHNNSTLMDINKDCKMKRKSVAYYK